MKPTPILFIFIAITTFFNYCQNEIFGDEEEKMTKYHTLCRKDNQMFVVDYMIGDTILKTQIGTKIYDSLYQNYKDIYPVFTISVKNGKISVLDISGVKVTGVLSKYNDIDSANFASGSGFFILYANN